MARAVEGHRGRGRRMRLRPLSSRPPSWDGVQRAACDPAPGRRRAHPPHQRQDEQRERAGQHPLAAVALPQLVAAPGHAAARARRERRRVVPARALEGRPARAGRLGRPAGAAVAPAAGKPHERGRALRDHHEARPLDPAAPVGLVVGVRERAVADARDGSSSRATRWRGTRRARRPAAAPRPTRSARRRCAGRRPPRPGARPSRRTCTSSQSPSWRPVRRMPRSCAL